MVTHLGPLFVTLGAMSPSLDLLLSYYRRELAGVVQTAVEPGTPPCPPGEELLWAEAGEVGGWLPLERAMEIRRLAGRVRYYEGRALQ
jgi:hypothetical protein